MDPSTVIILISSVVMLYNCVVCGIMIWHFWRQYKFDHWNENCAKREEEFQFSSCECNSKSEPCATHIGFQKHNKILTEERNNNKCVVNV